MEDLHTEIQDTSEETAEDKRTAIIKCQEIKSLEGYEEKGTLVHCQWKLVQPLWKTVYSRVVQSSVVSDSLWPMDWSMPDFPAYHLLEFAQIHVHCVSDTIQPSHPLSPPSPLAFNLFQNQVFSNKSALSIRCPKYWSFSFSICLPMNIHGWSPSGLTGLISFYLRDSQESSPIPQFKIINSSGLGLSLCYCPTLTSIHDYWKNLSFDYMHLFGKLMSLLFNVLFRFAVAFLSMSKQLLISWL